MSEVAKALGLPLTFRWGDRALTVAPLTFKVEALFAYELQRRVYQSIHLHRGAADEGAHAQHVRQWNDDNAAGEFEYDGRVGKAARETAAGTRELFFLRISDKTPGFSREDMAELYADIPAWNALVSFIRDMDRPPPNGQTPPARAEAEGPSRAPPT